MDWFEILEMGYNPPRFARTLSRRCRGEAPARPRQASEGQEERPPLRCRKREKKT
jgi:hypothetical protein